MGGWLHCARIVVVPTHLQLFHSMRRRALRCMLLDLVPVLEEAGCIYWLDFGTLLGVYRDDDIILHDNDCDIGILNPDWERLEALLNKRLQHKGYWTKVSCGEHLP